nr:oxytocin,3-Ser 8-Ile [Leucoraja ocellata]
CYSQNCPIG